jgi:pyruvate dehydrogenase E1 component alpha subunit
MLIPATTNIESPLRDNPEPALEAPLARDVLQQLFANMLRARLLSERLPKSVRTSEAILAGSVQNFEDDLVLSAGAHPVLSAICGEELSRVLLSSKDHPTATDSHARIVVSPPDSAIGIATGLALANRRLGSATSIVLFSLSSLTKGRVWEQSTLFAAAERLPLVIISDGTTGSRPVSRNHEGAALSRWPFPTIAVDGRDVIAVYRVTKEALSAARRGHGPTLVDCVNFVAPGRRGRDERDPVTAFRGYLQRHSLWSDFWYSELQARFKQEIAAANGRTKTRR